MLILDTTNKFGVEFSTMLTEKQARGLSARLTAAGFQDFRFTPRKTAEGAKKFLLVVEKLTIEDVSFHMLYINKMIESVTK